jgi:hypothetical protein
MDKVSIWVQWLGGAIGALLNSVFVVLLGWFIGWSHFSPVVAAPEGRGFGERRIIHLCRSEAVELAGSLHASQNYFCQTKS